MPVSNFSLIISQSVGHPSDLSYANWSVEAAVGDKFNFSNKNLTQRRVDICFRGENRCLGEIYEENWKAKGEAVTPAVTSVLE